MGQNPNPIHARGIRNLDCPYYRDCLNQAAKLHWETWACFACHLRQTRNVKARQPVPSEDTTPYYSLSPDIQLKKKTTLL